MKPIVGEIERKIRQGVSRTDIMSSLVSDIPLRTRPRSFFPLNNCQDDAVLYLKNVGLTLNMYNTYLDMLFTLSPT